MSLHDCSVHTAWDSLMCSSPKAHKAAKRFNWRLCSFCQSMTAKHAMYVLYRKFINTRIYATNKCLQRNEGMTGVHSRAPYERKQAVKAEAKHQKKTPHSRQWFQHTCLQVDCNLDHRTALGFGEALSCCATSHLKATCPAWDQTPSLPLRIVAPHRTQEVPMNPSLPTSACLPPMNPSQKKRNLSNSWEEDSISKERMRNGAMWSFSSSSNAGQTPYDPTEPTCVGDWVLPAASSLNSTCQPPAGTGSHSHDLFSIQSLAAFGITKSPWPQ